MRARPLLNADLGRRCACANRASGHSRKVSPWCPASAHPYLPKKLTKAPGNPHRSLPDVLTDTSRSPSPMRPGKAHRRLPQVLTGHSREGSPNAPVSAHLDHPGEAHRRLLKNLTFWAGSNFRGGNTAANTCEHRAENYDARRISRQTKRVSRCLPYACRCFHREQAATRSPLFRSRDRFECPAFVTGNIRNVPGSRGHRRHTAPVRAEPPTDATAAASS